MDKGGTTHLLIAESFDWRCVDDSLLELQREGNGVLGGHRLTG